MIDDRDMYYGYGGGYIPMNNMPQGMMPNTGFMPNTNTMPNNYSTSQINDMNERISRLERQVKRIDQRLTRLETPYANNLKYDNNTPDNNMYMM